MAGLVTIGLLLIAAGLVFVLASAFHGTRDEGGEVRGGAVVMIGPIPLVFGTDARWASVAVALALVLVLVYLLGVLR